MERGPAPRREGFPKDCRILRRAEFLRIQHQGQRIHGKRLVFQFLPGLGPESRLGITVSKKVGNAVVRNRVKRWIREAFRRHPELRPRRGAPHPAHPPDAGEPTPDTSGRPIARTYDLVITAKRDVPDFAWQAVHDELVQVIERFLAERGRGKKGRPPPARPEPARAPRDVPEED